MWKASEMHDWAISMLSLSAGSTEPSFRLVERKSVIARARRFWVSRSAFKKS